MIALLCLLCLNAHALIVEVNGQGEIGSDGMRLQLDQAEMNPLTGLYQFSIDGNVLCTGTLRVHIQRSATGLNDEFCCADQCTAGNGETTEELSFTPEGIASWYVHYTPSQKSEETITYVFEDDSDRLTLEVKYVYAPQAIDEVEATPTPSGMYLLN